MVLVICQACHKGWRTISASLPCTVLLTFSSHLQKQQIRNSNGLSPQLMLMLLLQRKLCSYLNKQAHNVSVIKELVLRKTVTNGGSYPPSSDHISFYCACNS